MTTMPQLPHDEDAERSVLGSMLLSPAVVGDVVDAVTAGDFFRPAHGHVFDAIARLYGRGAPVDPVTVKDELTNMGLLDSLGDPALLVSLIVNTPSAASARHYAEIVMENSMRRRLMGEASDLIRQAADPTLDVHDVLDVHQMVMASMGTAIINREPDDVSVEDFVKRPRDTISPWVVHGLIRRRHKLILVAGEGSGKALAVDTPVLTTGGWKTMGTVVPGDQVFGPDGVPTTIVAATAPFWGDCYRMVFSDGSEIVADANHLWRSNTYQHRSYPNNYGPSIVTTRSIAESLTVRSIAVANHAIEVTEPLQYPEADLIIDPYSFGAWLGDGTGCYPEITSADQQIVDEIKNAGWIVKKIKSSKYGWRISTETWGDSFYTRLKSLGVLRNKHIPSQYLTASREQRLSLLQGLMDTDGTVSDRGFNRGRGHGSSRCEFSVVNKTLATDVLELLIGLGIKATMKEGPAKIYGRFICTRYRIGFQTDLPVFRLQRKLDRLGPLNTNRAKLRYVKSCVPVPSALVRCVQVDREDGMFLAGKELIPTHNSWLMRFVAICAAYGVQPFRKQKIKPVRTLIVDLENPEDSLFDSFELMLREVTAFSPQDETVNRLWWRPAGINLRSRVDAAEFENVLRARRPDLVCLGPLYAAYENTSKDFGWETAAREVQVILKRLMVRYDFALIIEDHAPQDRSGGMRPYGSSFWRRWPDIGIGMEEVSEGSGVFNMKRWRGDRVPTDWPKQIERGNVSGSKWPFIGRWDDDGYANDDRF